MDFKWLFPKSQNKSVRDLKTEPGTLEFLIPAFIISLINYIEQNSALRYTFIDLLESWINWIIFVWIHGLSWQHFLANSKFLKSSWFRWYQHFKWIQSKCVICFRWKKRYRGGFHSGHGDFWSLFHKDVGSPDLIPPSVSGILTHIYYLPGKFFHPQAIALLGARGLSLSCWHFHFSQIIKYSLEQGLESQSPTSRVNILTIRLESHFLVFAVFLWDELIVLYKMDELKEDRLRKT